ncbi:MAG: ATP-dependent DNA helicase RecQ [Hyphomicrobiaceae bacterium]|jgi:ATP-dependent DNA helicase RecQ
MTKRASLAEARQVLTDVFKHADFRAGQDDAVVAALTGRDVLVLLPTGAGKSLCYQIPALVAAHRGNGTTIVISPLIALMQDQVASLGSRGITAAAMHSHLSDEERKQATAKFLDGELELLYVSPERAASPSFRRLLKRAAVALIAIDEAHCVSQWGHDFRPDYMLLGELRELPEVADAPMIALTATATPVVMKEIAARLGMRDPAIVRTDFDRPNLSFAVNAISTERERNDVLVEELDRAGIRGRSGRGRAILYCSTRKVTERVAKALRACGVSVGYYHAGRTKLARERAQQAFLAGRVRVLVATNAFGMGIDLPDVRLIVHFQIPGSIEAYYQEAGRAGRDGDPARCLLFFGRADLMTQRRLSEKSTTSAALGERRDDALAGIERYATQSNCRHQTLVSHFSGNPDEPECGRCDFCLGDMFLGGMFLGGNVETDSTASSRRASVPLVVLPDAANDVILAAVDRLKRPVGRRNLAQALRGGKAKTLSRGGLLTLPEYGTLSEFNEDSVIAAIDDLLASGLLQRTGKKYPTVWMPGKPLRAANKTRGDGTEAPVARKKATSSRYGGDIARALENYRKRTARTLGWKAYMIFQRRVIMEIDRKEPDSLEALSNIVGLGPAKIERFGEDVLGLVRQHRRKVT